MPAFSPDLTRPTNQALPWSQRLATRQARSVLLYAFLIGLFLSLTQILLDYKNQTSVLEGTLEQLIESVQKNAEAAIWDLDESLAMAVVEGLLGYEPITQAQLYSSDTLVAQKQSLQNTTSRPLLSALFGEVYTRQVNLFPPDSQGQPSIGHILLHVDPTFAGEAFLKRSLLVLGSGVARTLLLSCALLILFYFTLTRPVLAVSNLVLNYRPDQNMPRVPLDTHRQHIHGELKQLYHNAELLMDTVDQFGATLERQVQERTEQLTIAQQSLDSISACVMSIDNDARVVYANRASKTLFQQHVETLRCADFEPTQLLGQSLSALLKSDLTRMCATAQAGQKQPHDIVLGQLHFQISIEPLYGADRQSGGYTLEWIDKTDEKQIESALEESVTKACSGNLNIRLPEQGKRHFLGRLSLRINQMLQVNEEVFAELERALGALSKGELQSTINSSYGGTFSELHQHFNQTVEHLSKVIIQIKKTINTVLRSSTQLNQDHHSLDQHNQNIDVHLKQSHAHMRALSQSVDQHSQQVQVASTLSTQSQQQAQQGQLSTQAAQNSILELAELSEKISSITGNINDIAFQTNLLALNASVEAACAGDHGRGFAVVANEVQNLSLRSSDAASEIQKLSTQSSAGVNNCVSMIDKAQHTLNELHQCASQVNEVMNHVSSSSEDQLKQIKDTATALDLLYRASEEMGQLLLRTVAASEAMYAQSQEADKLTAFFTSPDKKDFAEAPMYSTFTSD